MSNQAMQPLDTSSISPTSPSSVIRKEAYASLNPYGPCGQAVHEGQGKVGGYRAAGALTLLRPVSTTTSHR